MCVGFLFRSVLLDEFFWRGDKIGLALSLVFEFKFASDLVHDCLLVFFTLLHDVLENVLLSLFDEKCTLALS